MLNLITKFENPIFRVLQRARPRHCRRPAPALGIGSRSSDGELNHDGAIDDGEVDRIGSGGGERTTSAGGINVVVVGDGGTNANLGDGMQDHDGAYDDGKVDYTRSNFGEGTNGPRGINGVVMGDGETNDSLGDSVRERDGY